MKRFFIIGLTVVAFVLSTAAVASAAPMSGSSAQDMNAQSWVGKTTSDLLIQMGVPNYSVQNGNGGQTLEYVKHVFQGRGNTIDLVQQFDVDQSGKITAEQTRQM